jgi:uncharacterized membrane protein
MLYLTFKFLHILAAIAALGANATYGIWLARAARDPQALGFTLRTLKLIDDRLANPAYGLLLITGFGLSGVGHIPIRTPWLLASLALYVVVVLVGLFGFTPTLKRQIEVVTRDGPAAPAYPPLARRARLQGMLLAVLVVSIVFLMVVKPPLWG